MYMHTNLFSLFGVFDFPPHGIYHFHLLASFRGPMLLTGAVSVNFTSSSCSSPTV